VVDPIPGDGDLAGGLVYSFAVETSDEGIVTATAGSVPPGSFDVVASLPAGTILWSQDGATGTVIVQNDLAEFIDQAVAAEFGDALPDDALDRSPTLRNGAWVFAAGSGLAIAGVVGLIAGVMPLGRRSPRSDRQSSRGSGAM
jgi:hypothetical protein